jgi:hypothetical protein
MTVSGSSTKIRFPVHLKECFLDASAEEVKLITDIVSVAQLIMMLPSGDLLDPEGNQWLSRR